MKWEFRQKSLGRAKFDFELNKGSFHPPKLQCNYMKPAHIAQGFSKNNAYGQFYLLTQAIKTSTCTLSPRETLKLS